MRSCAPALLLGALLALGSAALAADDPCRDARYTGDLTDLFVLPRELGSDWESLRETPLDPADDPELRAGGVVAVRSLHYTRAQQGRSQVCSMEIWGFSTAAAARSARSVIGRAGWRFELRGNLLMMSRGVTLGRAGGFQRGLLPECHRLADLTVGVASQRLGCSGPHD